MLKPFLISYPGVSSLKASFAGARAREAGGRMRWVTSQTQDQAERLGAADVENKHKREVQEVAGRPELGMGASQRRRGLYMNLRGERVALAS